MPERFKQATSTGMSIQDVPDDIVEKAVTRCVLFVRCPHCDMEQFVISRPGRITDESCIECGENNRVYG